MTGAAYVLNLILDFRGYWSTGTGRGGAETDSVVDRDGQHAPVIRGKHLEGNLRDAARHLAAWEADGWSGRAIDLLFGTDMRVPTQPVASLPGCLEIDDACLSPVLRERLKSDPKARGDVVRSIPSVRIGRDGVAMEDMMKLAEVAVPLSLSCSMRWGPQDRLIANPSAGGEIASLSSVWKAMILACLPLVGSLGAHRSRGYGRVHLREAA